MEAVRRLEELLVEVPKMILAFDEQEFVSKGSTERWSKQEFFGHLCDAAVINYRRFVNILLSEEAVTIIRYPQNELVELHDYQNRHTREDLLNWWLMINKQIVSLMQNVDDEQWNKPCILPDGTEVTLQWMFANYFLSHMIRHLKQIENE